MKRKKYIGNTKISIQYLHIMNNFKNITTSVSTTSPFKVTMGDNTKHTSKPTNPGVISNLLKVHQEINTPTELAKLLTYPNGMSFSPSIFNGSRKDANWKSQSVYALDFDDGITPDEIYNRCEEHNLIPNIAYNSFSNTEEKRKFRFIFFLDEVITDKEESKRISLSLMCLFPESDKACKDFSRFFYGGNELLSSNDELNKKQAFVDAIKPFYTEITKSKSKNSKNNTFNYVRDASITSYNHTAESIKKYCNIAYNHAITACPLSKFGTNKATFFASMCNNYGIDINDAEMYMCGYVTSDKMGERRNTLHDIYTRYSNQFGVFMAEEKFKQEEYVKEIQEAAIEENKNAYHLGKTQYISDLGIILTDDSYIIAKTGLGKTTAIAKMSKLSKVVVFPNQAGLEDYLNSNPTATTYYQKLKNVKDGDKLIATTYRSFPIVAAMLTKNVYDLFFDEAHYFTTATSLSYLANPLSDALDASDGFAHVHLMSGTPIFNFDVRLQNKKVIKITKDSTSEQNAYIIKADDTIKTAQEIVKNCKLQKQKFAIYLNNKNEEGILGKMGAALSDLKMPPINADTKHTDAYKKIIIDGDLTDYDGFISTSLTNDAFSLTKTSDVFNDIVLEEASSVDLAQRTRRARDAKKQITTIIKKNNEKRDEDGNLIDEPTPYFNLNDTLVYEREKQNLAFDFAQKFATGDALIRLVKLLRTEGACIKIDKDGYLKKDDLLLSNKIYQRMTYVENRNPQLMKAQLAKYDITLSDKTYKSDFTFTKEESDIIKEVVAVTKAVNENEIETILSSFENDTVQQNARIKNTDETISALELELRTKADIITKFIDNEEVEVETYTNSEVDDILNEIVSPIEKVEDKKNETVKNAVNKLREIGFTQRKFNVFLRAVKARKNYFDENVGENELIRKLENKIFATEIGKQYSSDELNAVLQEVYTKAGYTKVSKTHTTRLIKDYIGLKKVRVNKLDENGAFVVERVMKKDENGKMQVVTFEGSDGEIYEELKPVRECKFEVINHNVFGLKDIITPKEQQADEYATMMNDIKLGNKTK